MSKKEVGFEIIDAIASEYSWSLNYILQLPIDVITNLCIVISARKKREQSMNAKIIGIATACAFSGKLDKLEGLFKETDDNEDDSQLISQLRQLWTSQGKSIEEFEEKLKNGEVTF